MTKKIVILIVITVITVLGVGCYYLWEFKRQQQILVYNNSSNEYRVALNKNNISNLKVKTNVINNIYDSKINLILSGSVTTSEYGKLNFAEPYYPKWSVIDNLITIKLQELDCQIQDDNQIIILARGIPNPDKPELEFNIACELRDLKPNKYSIKYGENGSVIDTFEIKQINP
jgi:hypothetical protein